MNDAGALAGAPSMVLRDVLTVGCGQLVYISMLVSVGSILLPVRCAKDGWVVDGVRPGIFMAVMAQNLVMVEY
jgi:hypothetical protein